MSAEGHWCGPTACECGETHGCICGWCEITANYILGLDD